MKLSFVMIVALFTIPFAPSQETPKSTDSVAWGSAVNGLRLGAVFGSDPSKPTLRVILQNVGSESTDVVMGYDNGRDPVYNLRFVAKARDGKVLEGSDIAVYFPVEGLVQPVSVRLRAWAMHEIVFPLKNIIYSSRTDTLETLVKDGYSVRVSFESDGGGPLGGKLSHGWVGELNSGELSTAR